MLDVRDDVDLIEEDTGVDDVESGVIDGPGEDHVLEELEAVSVVNFALNYRVADGDRLMEMRLGLQKFSVVCFVVRKVRVI